jgi:hypothetical protein
VQGSAKTTFLYTGDRWSVKNYSMSRIVLLPIEVSGTKLKVDWYDQWDIDTKTGEWSAGSKNFIDGVYSITSKHSGLSLGTSGTSVQQQKYTGDKSQLWRIQNIGASHLKITSVASGKGLDVSGASRTEGAKIIHYTWSDAFNQKWHILDCGNGLHRFINVNTLGKALEIANGSTAAGSEAVLGNFNYSDNQLFKITQVHPAVQSGMWYMVINRSSGLALTHVDGTSAHQTTAQQKPAQIWQINDLYNSNYSLINNLTGNALDNGGIPENGASIVTGASDNRYSQQWQIVPVTGSYYKIVNRYSGKCIDNKDGATAEGSKLIQYSDYASANTNQQWTLVRVEKVSVPPGQRYSTARVENKKSGSHQNTLYDLRGVLQHRTQGDGSASPPSGVFIVRNNASSGATTRYHCVAIFK